MKKHLVHEFSVSSERRINKTNFIKTNATVTRVAEYIVVFFIFIDKLKWFIGLLLPVVFV